MPYDPQAHVKAAAKTGLYRSFPSRFSDMTADQESAFLNRQAQTIKAMEPKDVKTTIVVSVDKADQVRWVGTSRRPELAAQALRELADHLDPPAG